VPHAGQVVIGGMRCGAPCAGGGSIALALLIESAMTAVPRANPTRNAELIARFPTGRWGKPEDLTGPALFLCSPLAGFVTGAILPVDGGYLVS